jgi:hypothetical protein
MRSNTLAFLLSGLLGCAAQAADFHVASSTGNVKIYTTSKALLIGVAAYTSDSWNALPTVPAEIALLRDALIRQGFEAEDIEIVLNPKAPRLREKVRRFFQAPVESDTRLFLFVSSHGWSDGKESGFLLPVDAPASRDPKFFEKALGMDEVNLWSEKTRAKHVLMVFDSCFSGAVFLSKGEANLPGALFINDAEQPVRQFITAGSKDQKVPARSDFTPMLVRGLDGAADIYPDGVITATELGYWLKAKITPLNRQTPQYGTSNHRLFQKGDVMFGIPGAATVTPGAAGARVIPLSKTGATPETRSEVQALRDSTRPHPAFENIKLYYYQKASDRDTITKSLDAARIPYLKTRATLPDKFAVSAIACGNDVPIESVRTLATVLTNNGVAIRAIFPFRDARIKPARIELVSLSTNAQALEAITTPPLSLEQIANIDDCRWLQNR